MHVQADVMVKAPRETVWAVVSDIPNAASTIKGIEKVEVLEQPKGEGIVGLKWRETRTMFGKQATETMWITDASAPSFYETRAENSGAIYTTRIALQDAGAGVTRLSMDFGAEPRTFGARILGAVFGALMKGSMRKAILKDLEDIKAAAEARRT